MINWQYFPKSDPAPDHVRSVVEVFSAREDEVESASNALRSDDVLAIVRPGLIDLGFTVELDKSTSGKIKVPVLFGRNGHVEQSFDADAWNRTTKTVLEVEAGRAVVNNQFLKDLFQACMMHDVDYLVIAVRKIYKAGRDFDKVVTFFDTLYSSARLQLPLTGILVIGY